MRKKIKSNKKLFSIYPLASKPGSPIGRQRLAEGTTQSFYSRGRLMLHANWGSKLQIPNFKLQIPNSKLQTPNSKLLHPQSP